MKVSRLIIHQPDAHYRIPFSYQRRFTYPIPPFSTIKGLICNVLGIKNEEDEDFRKIKEGLSLAIYGKYESLVKEYTWFRNLKISSHVDKFHSPSNRVVDGIVQHPGGQMPVKVDVLHNVRLIVYIYHENDKFLEKICNAFAEPENRNTVLHLGRSEDWINIEDLKSIELTREISEKIPYYCWIPAPEFVDYNFVDEEYEKFFNSLSGNLLRLPTFYSLINNQRIFNHYVKVKLFEGGGFPKNGFYVDKELENLPVIFTSIGGKIE